MKTILTSILLALSLSVYAQSNFYKLSIGGGAGFTRSYADLPEHNYGKAFYGTADFMFTPFMSLGLEVQNGTIKGGQDLTDVNGRMFQNNYRSLTANGKLYLGAFVDYKHHNFLNYIKGLYLGAGVGAIQNRMDVNMFSTIPEYKTPDRTQTKEAIIPMNLGINLYFPDQSGQYRYVVNINYQRTITLGEGLDGYDDSTVTFKNGNPDVFTYFTLGVKYNFGLLGSSTKTFKKY